MPTQVIVFVILLTFCALLLVWDVAREDHCSQCPHCRSLQQDRRIEKEARLHSDYHSYAGGIARDCRDADCRGRRRGK